MTAQIGDIYRYKEHKYSIVVLSNSMPFRPQDYDITPEACCSACWEGYWCKYSISDKEIVLNILNINTKNGHYPEINGISPMNEQANKKLRYMGSHLYQHINIKIPYTSRILLETIGHSGMAEKLRRQIDENSQFIRTDKESINKVIESSFSLDMKEKAWWIA